jgi:flagellar biosynthesis GTPase FlhF
MVAINEVARGLACQCVCPECRRLLVAAKGKIKRHHFRHAREVGGPCHATPESVLHRYAKQSICERRLLRLPDGIKMGRIVNATPEYRGLGGEVIPDVYVEFERGPVAVEIFVTNKKSDEHREWYNARRLAAIEIDCSDNDEDEGSRDWDWFIAIEAPREWLSPPEHIRQQREVAEAAKRQREAAERAEAEAARIRRLFEEIRRQEEAESQKREAAEQAERAYQRRLQAQREAEAKALEEQHRREQVIRRERQKRQAEHQAVSIADVLWAEMEARAAERWGTHRLMAEGRDAQARRAGGALGGANLEQS